jgi:hypothetical protein
MAGRAAGKINWLHSAVCAWGRSRQRIPHDRTRRIGYAVWAGNFSLGENDHDSQRRKPLARTLFGVKQRCRRAAALTSGERGRDGHVRAASPPGLLEAQQPSRPLLSPRMPLLVRADFLGQLAARISMYRESAHARLLIFPPRGNLLGPCEPSPCASMAGG